MLPGTFQSTIPTQKGARVPLSSAHELSGGTGLCLPLAFTYAGAHKQSTSTNTQHTHDDMVGLLLAWYCSYAYQHHSNLVEKTCLITSHDPSKKGLEVIRGQPPAYNQNRRPRASHLYFARPWPADTGLSGPSRPKSRVRSDEHIASITFAL
jgi:hypothetical protein